MHYHHFVSPCVITFSFILCLVRSDGSPFAYLLKKGINKCVCYFRTYYHYISTITHTPSISF
jgi:hypothetical protein